MFKKKKKYEFQTVYSKNPETNAYIIEVSLDDYSELFNGWDASPLRRKDLEPELLEYLEQAATEIPIKESIELCFYRPLYIKDDDKESKSITGIKNNFKVVISFIQKALNTNYRQLLTYMTLSILFLIGAYLLRNFDSFELLFSIMVEGLFIGGWFLLWEAFTVFFFTSHESRKRKKIFYRFLDSEIYFRDTKE